MTDKLIKGFEDFCRETYHGDDALMPRLIAEGQAPEYFIISCIDSRSNPGTIFRPAPGTFFAHNAMGAIVRPYHKGTALSAALQFALNYNKVDKIVILGHTSCGAVKALIENIEDDEISSFITVAQTALHAAEDKCGPSCSKDALNRHAEEEIVLLSAENLKTYPAVAKALKEGRVTIKPWLFDMENKALLEYDEQTKEFITITKDEE